MCMYDYGDSGSVVLHDRNPKARKEHKCDECRRIIHKGEQYNVQRVVFEGMAATYKACRHCEVIRSWLTKECGGYVYEGVREDIDEHVQYGHNIRVRMLAIGMSRKWRRKDGRMWPVPKVPPITKHSHVH